VLHRPLGKQTASFWPASVKFLPQENLTTLPA
jgi:hypothetical protein